MARTAWISIFVAALMGSPVYATVFSFQCPVDCSESNGGGLLTQSEVSFDDVLLEFTWNATYQESNGRLPDGFWLVVSEGRARNESENGLAILYGDRATGRGREKVIEAGIAFVAPLVEHGGSQEDRGQDKQAHGPRYRGDELHWMPI